MSKHTLIAAVIGQLQADLAVCEQAANEAHQAATHEESVAENQYDTLGLEASYLAEGQSRRVAEIQQEIAAWQALPETGFYEDDPVISGCLVMLQAMDTEEQRLLLLGPAAGGMKLSHAGMTVTVVTPEAPLGAQLTGKYVGDCVMIAATEFEITDVQ
ncbi:GreA/GreB family elongation factor [Aliamphritea hakodatensis]|uniref:GreA/GreB family elongation factor n=1 Tax=Aliamphritea hakodatensis TaxID=2895352 RepID=UPI0022FD8C7D|nr:transcription elongation factor GreAB [Aliamphritea hakodatensis]